MKTRSRGPPTAKGEALKSPRSKGVTADRRRTARPAAAARPKPRVQPAAAPKTAPAKKRVNLSATTHKGHGRSPAHDLAVVGFVEFALEHARPGLSPGFSSANLAPAGLPADVRALTTVNVCAAYLQYHRVDLREPTFRKRVQEIFGKPWRRLNADPAATLSRVAECKARVGAELAAAALGADGVKEGKAKAKAAAPAPAAPAVVAPAVVAPAVVAPAAVAPTAPARAAPVEAPAPAAPAARALAVYGDADEWGPPPQMAAPVFLEMDD
jgi:hypothetical protein